MSDGWIVRPFGNPFKSDQNPTTNHQLTTL